MTEDQLDALGDVLAEMGKQARQTEAVIRDLAAVAVGNVKHVRNGACPDEIEGDKVRDRDCPACCALIAADQAMSITDTVIH